MPRHPIADRPGDQRPWRRAVRPSLAGLLAVVGGAGTAAVVDGDAADPQSPAPAIAVSYRDLPPALDLEPYASVELGLSDGANSLVDVAVLPDGGAVLQDIDGGAAYLVGSDGTTSGAIAVEQTPFAPAATTGPVLYGLTSDATGVIGMVAVALAGPNTGRVVATSPVADPGPYLEIPATLFGNAPDGVIARGRTPGAVMIGHVDITGEPVTIGGLRDLVTIGDDNVVRDSGNPAVAWPLTVGRHPDAVPPYGGESPPAPSADRLTVYWTMIGPPSDPTEPGLVDGTMPVIAVLRPGGTGTWYSIPDGWRVAASDSGGTIFVRRAGSTVELARLSDALGRQPVPWCAEYSDRYEYPLRICDSGEAVRAAQRVLAGIDAHLHVDGFFGPHTQVAVRTFQRLRGLEADGLIGPDTWAALAADAQWAGTDRNRNGLLEPWELEGVPAETAVVRCARYDNVDGYPVQACDSGDAVRVIQHLLLVILEADLDVDGFFGPATEQAVRRYQEINGLEVDGRVGPETWRALAPPLFFGEDADGSGMVDPWELLPPPGVGVDVTWALVLAASEDSGDAVFDRPIEAAAAARSFGFAPIDCDDGAAAALGMPAGAWALIEFFDTEWAANRWRGFFSSKGVDGRVVRVGASDAEGCFDFPWDD